MFLTNVALILLFSWGCAQDNGKKYASVSEVARKVLEVAEYDRRVSPNQVKGKGGAVLVKIGFFIQEFHHISDAKMEYAASMYLRRYWDDSRLAFRDISKKSKYTFKNDYVASFWVPDVFIVNERKAEFHMLTQPAESITLLPTGGINYSSRFSMYMSCRMNLEIFPFDTQTCSIELQSYSYNQDSLRMTWTADAIAVPDKNPSLRSFQYMGHKTESCSTVYTSGAFPCLRVNFEFKRDFTYYVITTYAPSAFVVCLSWVAFWVSPEAIPGRVTLGSTTVLTIITQQFIGGLSLPRVSYTKAVDIWMVGCMTFVFLALIEFACVQIALQKDMKKMMKKQAEKAEIIRSAGQKRSQYGILNQIAQYLAEIQPRKQNAMSERIDAVSRILLPLLFVTFMVSYWVFYLHFEGDLGISINEEKNYELEK